MAKEVRLCLLEVNVAFAANEAYTGFSVLFDHIVLELRDRPMLVAVQRSLVPKGVAADFAFEHSFFIITVHQDVQLS